MQEKYKTILKIGTAITIGGTLLYFLSGRPEKPRKQRQELKSVDKIAQEDSKFGEKLLEIQYDPFSNNYPLWI